MISRALGLVALLALTAATPAHAALPVPATRAEADQLASSPGGRDRDRALAAWAKKAPLDDVLWVLRYGPERIGSAEDVLVKAAIDRMPRSRPALARQLTMRAELSRPGALRKHLSFAELEALRPRASVFRVAALLPESGDYADFARSVHRGLVAGVTFGRPATLPPIEVERHSTGEEDPARAIAAFDSASHHCAIAVGALLSSPTLAVSAAARVLAMPLISPTATDESIGRVGAAISQVGPGQTERARMLARAVVRDGARIGLVGNRSALAGEFARGFAAAAESLGAAIVRRETYAEGGGDFRAIARSLKAAEVQVAFWDGEPRECEALVRSLASEGVRVQVVGAAALAPEQHHANVRALMEGVMWPGEDWALEPALAAHADSLAALQGESGGAGTLWVRGYLAGRRVAAAIDAGARTREDVIRALQHSDPALRSGGFLDCRRDGARLPLFTARRGKSVEWEGR